MPDVKKTKTKGKVVKGKPKGKGKAKKGVSVSEDKRPPYDFSGIKKQEVYWKDPFKPQIYPRIQGHEAIRKEYLSQMLGRTLQGGGAVVGAQGRILSQQPLPQPSLPPAFNAPQQSQGGFDSVMKYLLNEQIAKEKEYSRGGGGGGKALTKEQSQREKDLEDELKAAKEALNKLVKETPVKKEPGGLTGAESWNAPEPWRLVVDPESGESYFENPVTNETKSLKQMRKFMQQQRFQEMEIEKEKQMEESQREEGGGGGGGPPPESPFPKPPPLKPKVPVSKSERQKLIEERRRRVEEAPRRKRKRKRKRNALFKNMFFVEFLNLF